MLTGEYPVWPGKDLQARSTNLLEAISKGAPLKIKIEASSGFAWKSGYAARVAA